MTTYQICGNTIVILADNQYTVLAITIACKNEYAGKYTAINCIGLSQIEISLAISQAENTPITTFPSFLFAQKYAEMMVQNMLNNELCALEAFADAANALLHIEITAEVAEQDEANEIAEAFAYDSSRSYSHVQVCELAGLPLQASVYLHTYSNGDHEAGNPLAVCVTDKCEFGYAHLGFVSNWRNNGMYAAVLTNCEGDAEKIGNFATALEAQAAILRIVCDTIEAWAAVAHASLAIEPTPTPENADTDFEYEALSAGRVFDAPTSVLNKQYEIPAELSDIETLIDEIAADEYEDLQAIDKEIADLQARLLSLGSTRQDIIEEYAYWRGKCEQAKDDIEESEAYETNDAYDDLRNSVWFATGQDIM